MRRLSGLSKCNSSTHARKWLRTYVFTWGVRVAVTFSPKALTSWPLAPRGIRCVLVSHDGQGECRRADRGEETRSPLLLVHYSRGLLRFRLGIVSRPVTQSFACTVPLRESKFTVTPLLRESEREVEVRSAALLRWKSAGWRHHKPASIKASVTANESQLTSVMCQLCCKRAGNLSSGAITFYSYILCVCLKQIYAVKHSAWY